MNNALIIGKLSKRVGLPTKTIRFYENIGLIEKAKRAENGYRTYTKKAVEELTLIKYARDLGLPIAEMKKLLFGCPQKNCQHNKQYIETEIVNYENVLEEKIKQLQTLKKRLNNLRNKLEMPNNCDSNDTYCCNILKQLMDTSKGGE